MSLLEKGSQGSAFDDDWCFRHICFATQPISGSRAGLAEPVLWSDEHLVALLAFSDFERDNFGDSLPRVHQINTFRGDDFFATCWNKGRTRRQRHFTTLNGLWDSMGVASRHVVTLGRTASYTYAPRAGRRGIVGNGAPGSMVDEFKLRSTMAGLSRCKKTSCRAGWSVHGPRQHLHYIAQKTFQEENVDQVWSNSTRIGECLSQFWSKLVKLW